MMWRWLLVFSVGLIGQVAWAQRGLAPGERDSLWTVWTNEMESDSIRLKAIQRIAWHGYLFSQPDSAHYFATLQYKFAEERGLRVPMSSALNIQGTAKNFQGDWESALQLYQQSLAIGREQGDSQGVAVCLNNMGNIFKNQGDYEKAIDCFFESLRLREDLGDSLGIASSYGNIANLYNNQGFYQEALVHFERCLVIMERLDNVRAVAGTLNNMGLAYSELGDLERAYDMYTEALPLHEQTGDARGAAGAWTNIGNIHFERRNFIDAELAHRKSLELRQTLGDNNGMAQSYFHLGKIEAALNRYESAIQLGNRAYELAEKVGDIQITSDVANLLYESYKAIGKYEKSLLMHEVHILMRDSLLREENQRELLQRQFKYDSEKREAEFQAQQDRKDALAREELLRQRSQRNLLGLGFVVLLSIGGGAGVFFYQRKKAQYRYQSILLELKAVKAQISPHFFFNAMNSVVNMMTSNSGQNAEAFLVKYARLMRQILRDSDRELIALQQEIEVLTNYLELELIRLPGRFSFRFEVDERLDLEAVLLPSMLIQPLVENAVWHGVALLDGGGEIRISFKPMGELLCVAVVDNGAGRSGFREKSLEPAGSSITAQRIALYNLRYGTKGELKLIDERRGVRAEFCVPLIEG